MEGTGGYFRGTNIDQDGRFANKEKKLLKSMVFEPILSTKVNMKKVKLDTLKPWISNRINSILGFEDEVVIQFVFEMLESDKVNPQQMQIQLTGFLQAYHARIFMKQLWEMVVSAQSNQSGIPDQIIQAKKAEIMRKRMIEASNVSMNDNNKDNQTSSDLVKTNEELDIDASMLILQQYETKEEDTRKEHSRSRKSRQTGSSSLDRKHRSEHRSSRRRRERGRDNSPDSRYSSNNRRTRDYVPDDRKYNDSSNKRNRYKSPNERKHNLSRNRRNHEYSSDDRKYNDSRKEKNENKTKTNFDRRASSNDSNDRVKHRRNHRADKYNSSEDNYKRTRRADKYSGSSKRRQRDDNDEYCRRNERSQRKKSHSISSSPGDSRRARNKKNRESSSLDKNTQVERSNKKTKSGSIDRYSNDIRTKSDLHSTYENKSIRKRQISHSRSNSSENYPVNNSQRKSRNRTSSLSDHQNSDNNKDTQSEDEEQLRKLALESLNRKKA